MAELKTKETNASVDDFLDGVENERRRRFEETKDRQEELWGREDERYAKDLEYFNESTRLSRERLATVTESAWVNPHRSCQTKHRR